MWQALSEGWFGVNAEGEPVAQRDRKSKVVRLEIKKDLNGTPIFPVEDQSDKWPVKTREYVVRDFLTAQYSKCHLVQFI